ncbi:unnamed protein product [Gadus morhua 'NCC']
METSEIPTTETGQTQESFNVVMNSKPLHLFIKRETQTLGIVVLMFGCAELLMASEFFFIYNLSYVYMTFGQGAVFFICGILSISSVRHPSKKCVTICLAMYVVTLIGIAISTLINIKFFADLFHYFEHELPSHLMKNVIEAILFLCSLCVSGLLIFLSTAARRALKSTQSQVIVQHVNPAMTLETIPTE